MIFRAQGALPAAFAWPAAVGRGMTTGLAAPFVAWELAGERGRRLPVGFNVFGLADLIDASTLGARKAITAALACRPASDRGHRLH